MKKGMRVCAALIAVLLMGGCSVFSQNETTTTSKTSTSRVARGDLVLGLSADGSITLPVTGLDFAVSGVIKNIYVQTGDMVKKGDLLAELDDTDLQLALKTAQNNLEKALLSYEEAVTTAEYNLKTEKINFETTKRQLDTDFDSYNYELSIENAKLAVERRNRDYEDTVKANEIAEEAAKLTLSRRQTELAEAEAELAEAEAAEYAAFDTFNYENNVKSAQTAVDRRYTDLKQAKRDLSKARNDYELDLKSDDDDIYYAAKSVVSGYENAVTSAQNNYNDAVEALRIAQESLSRDAQSYETDEIKRLSDAVKSAKQAADDAQTAYNNVQIDSRKSLISARQAIDDAEKELADAYENLSRGEESYRDDQLNTRNTYDTQQLKIDNLTNSTSSIQTALFNIEEARNDVASAENDLAKIRITAPIDGEVLNVTKKVGELVTENANAPGVFMGSGNTSNNFITVRDLSEIYLTAKIPEGDIVGLSVGQKIRVAVDALDEENILATVHAISSIPNTDSSGIITYEVVGILDEFNDNIRDNMSVFLTFIKREKNGVVLIPNKSVFMEDGQQYVYVQIAEGNLEKRAVSCGLSNGSQTEVLEGLEIGETVIVGKVSV